MEENNFRRFQAIMQVMTGIGAVIVFFVGLNQYYSEQANLLERRVEAERLARDREFRRELWLRQLDVVSEIADTASRIAAAGAEDDAPAFDAAVQDYERLYWGNVTFVDDPDLLDAMDALRDEISNFRQGYEPIVDLSALGMIKLRAHDVAMACRRVVRDKGEDYADLGAVSW